MKLFAIEIAVHQMGDLVEGVHLYALLRGSSKKSFLSHSKFTQILKSIFVCTICRRVGDSIELIIFKNDPKFKNDQDN